MDKDQREYYLREQMKAIQTELGEGDLWIKEVGDLKEKVVAAAMPDEANKAALKELERLGQMPAMSPESGIIRTYLDWLIELPWHTRTNDNLDLNHAQKLLDEQHFGLPKAKDRILEYIAVRSLAKDSPRVRSPILCFVGPRNRKNFTRQINRRGVGAQVCACVARWRARRSGNTRTPPHVYRRVARTDHPNDAAWRHSQSVDHA